jgi:hypothetical protein
VVSAPAASLPHAQAVITALTAASLTAYLSEATPDVNGLPPVPPYVTVHPSAGFTGSGLGTLGDRFKDLEFSFQTTAVGDTAEQALNIHDRVLVALAGATPAVAGRNVQPIWLEEPPQPIQRDDTPAVPLFYGVARWMFRTTA